MFRAVCSLVPAALMLCLVFAGTARCSTHESGSLDAQVRMLDDCKVALVRLGKKVGADLENNLESPDQVALRDLVFFCRVAELELHHFVDVYVLSRSPGIGEGFRNAKMKELKTRGKDIVFDLKKRLKYVEADSPVQPSKSIEAYRAEIETQLRKAVSVLEVIVEKLGKIKTDGF